MTIDPALLALLVCPVDRSPLHPDDSDQELICKGCGLAYPVRDGVPVVLTDHARRTR